MGLGPKGKIIDADYFLQIAAENKYAPAMIDKAQRLAAAGKFVDAKTILTDCAALGFKAARFALARLYENTSSPFSNLDSAMSIYTALIKAGSINATLALSDLYSGKQAKKYKDPALAMSIALKPAIANNARAMVTVANLLLEKNVGKRTEALTWLTKAAELNDREAIFLLGLLYSNTKAEDGMLDKTKGAVFTRKAAEMGHPEAMNLLGNLYALGAGVEKDMVRYRYWLNQAKLKGIGKGYVQADNSLNKYRAFLDGVVNYQPSTYLITKNQYGNVVNTELIDGSLLHYVGAGLLNMLGESQRIKQDIINDLRIIKSDDISTTWGGLLSSVVKIENLKKGDKLDVSVSGTVNFGSVAGTGGPEGVSNTIVRSFSYIPDLNHGAVLFACDKAPVVGTGKAMLNYELAMPGNIGLFVNDKQPENNEGYFDVKIVVYK